MEVKEEGMYGGMGDMTGGMMDDMICPRDPCEILRNLIQSEQMELPIYKQLAQTAPSSCLRMMFTHMAAEDAMKVQRLCNLAGKFGCGNIGAGTGSSPGSAPGCPPLFYNKEEQAEKK